MKKILLTFSAILIILTGCSEPVKMYEKAPEGAYQKHLQIDAFGCLKGTEWFHIKGGRTWHKYTPEKKCNY